MGVSHRLLIIAQVGKPVEVESKFDWLLNGLVPRENNFFTNLSFVKEGASHVGFSNSQKPADTTLGKEFHLFWDLGSL